MNTEEQLLEFINKLDPRTIKEGDKLYKGSCRYHSFHIGNYTVFRCGDVILTSKDKDPVYVIESAKVWAAVRDSFVAVRDSDRDTLIKGEIELALKNKT